MIEEQYVTEFGSSAPLVMGEIYGVRAFKYRKDEGKLAAEFTPFVWESGVNKALHYGIDILGTGTDMWGQDASTAKPCAGVGVCTLCGFYAYHTGELEYGRPGRSVFGVIKGWGMTEVGTRGFRSSQAEIVALYIPKNKTEPMGKYERMVRWTQRHFWGGYWAVGLILVNFLFSIFSNLWHPLIYVVPFTSFSWFWITVCKLSLRYDGSNYVRQLKDGLDIDYDVIKSNYPNAIWYVDFDEMVKDYDIQASADFMKRFKEFSGVGF